MSGIVDETNDSTPDAAAADPVPLPTRTGQITGLLRRKVPAAERKISERILSGLGWRPHFALLLGIGEVEEEIDAARQTLASLRDQAYGDWRAVILRRGRVVPDEAATRLIAGFETLSARIDVRLDVAAGAPLADLARSGDRPARVDMIGVLLAGDVLGADALLEMAVWSGLHPEDEFFYSDEWRISPASGKREVFFKPRWSPDLLASTNYIGRFWCTLPTVLTRAGASMEEWFQFGDYDLVLRCTEQTPGVGHVPSVLCERGRSQLDHPDQERAALARAMQRRGIQGSVADGSTSGSYRMRQERRERGLVSIVIPTCGAEGRIIACIETLRATTAYKNTETICVDNIPATQADVKEWVRRNADRVVSCDEPFNWSRFNNLAAREAKGEFLLFLNDDVEIVEPDWLDALLDHAERQQVGVVGARLLYPDGHVQHAGIFWTPRGGRHAFRGLPASAPGYFGMALSERNVLAVTGACMLVRRSEFDALGGFEERHTIVNNDVDFCLRCWERGKSVVYTPHATLLHHEGISRAALGDVFDSDAFYRRWGARLAAGDPFHHPFLSLDDDDFVPSGEPVELVYPSRPLFDPAEIKNILAVKLDHIGDFITAVPALRYLRREFPKARLHLLAAPGSIQLSALVEGLSGTIEFEFFFTQSGLGQRELAEADLKALHERLRGYEFDLAIDLRKSPETRFLLPLTGARWLAGFDRDNQFPWLDIALEWETDPAAERKRSHISDDLLRLAMAVVAAGKPIERFSHGAAPPAVSAQRSGRTLAGRKLVCVHPGVGSPIRQWPPEYFAALIDMLVGSHELDIVLIGGEHEADIAARVIARVKRPEAVRSAVGAVGLRELPQLLASAALFVGNNSGPHHLAAGYGVPTVGVHSGTVDAREWGPNGANGVAIRKNTVCSPCYFSDPAQCPRELACMTQLQPAEVYEVCRRLLAIDTSGLDGRDRWVAFATEIAN